jgi:O-antigen/teichoic acid export membrane protein
MRGTLFAQAIGFAVLPILTRLYQPSDFGALQLYQSLLSVLLVMATLRYEIALLRATSTLELKSLLIACCTINLVGAALLGLGAFFLWLIDPIASWLSVPNWAWLLPVSFLISGISQFATYWLTRNKAFSQSANGKIAQSICYVGTGGLFGVVRPSPAGLILADIVGKLGSLAWTYRWYRQEWRHLGGPISWQDVKFALRTYREFPFIAVPGGLVNALGGMMTPIMIYATFSAETSGQYGLVERSLTLPVALVLVAVSQVFASQFSERLRAGARSARSLFHNYVFWLSLLGLLPTALLVFSAPELFSIIFGPEWVQAGHFARILAPTYFFLLVAGSTNMTLMLLGMQKTQMVWEVGRLAAMLAFWAFVRHANWSSDDAVLGHAIITTLACFAFLAMAEIGLRFHQPGGVSDVEP